MRSELLLLFLGLASHASGVSSRHHSATDVTIINTQNVKQTDDLNPIGGNLDGVDYRGRTQNYVNLIRQAQQFMAAANSSAPAIVDRSGWPLESFTVYLQTLGADLQGNYSIHAKGLANITSLKDGVVADLNYDWDSDTTSAVLTITDPNATDIELLFDNVSATGVQNISVLLPGFTLDQANDLNPAYVKQLQRYDTLRILAVTSVDGVFMTNWTQRATPETNPSWSTFCCPSWRSDASVPWEGIAQVAHTVKPTHMWLNLQTLGNDDFYLQLAQFIKVQFPPDVPLYLEYGNEMWNSDLAQYRVKLLANASVTQDGDPYKLNYDHCNNGDLWGARLTAYNAAVRIPGLFAKVYDEGNVGRGKYIRPLLAAQSSYAPFVSDQLTYLENTQDGAIDRLASLAMAAYVHLEHNISSWDNLTANDILASWNRSVALAKPQIQTEFALHAVVVNWFAVPEMRGYESGVASFGGNSLPGKVAANKSPLVQGIVEQMYDYWHQHQFGTLNYWHAGVQDYNWSFGQWSTHWRQSVPVTPKTMALDAVRGRRRPAPALGTALPVHNYSSALYVGYYSKVPGAAPSNPNITYVKQNLTVSYLFTTPVARKTELTIHTSTYNASITECRLTVTLASSNMPRRVSKVVNVPATTGRGDYRASVVPLEFPAGTSVVRFAMSGGGSCVDTISKDQVMLLMCIGSFDIE